MAALTTRVKYASTRKGPRELRVQEDLGNPYRDIPPPRYGWRFLAGRCAEVVQREAERKHISTMLAYARYRTAAVATASRSRRYLQSS